MFFACGGIEAVQKLETASFDVLVTDLRMPELDGTELLHIANERYPHMARIVLSGYAEENSALKNMALSHHYLINPSIK
jgi:YesN/AraC family two-component response regulator